jgi:N-dimethylarginine dimethylaminohydrolase
MSNKKPGNLWKPGQTGNPKGRPPGQSEITKLRKSIMSDAPDILAGLVTAAKAGDVQAARLILERVLPPVKPMEQAIELELTGDTLTDQGRAVLGAVSAGALAPGQGSQLIAAIGALARVVEIDELTKRIIKLEESKNSKP